MTADQVQGVLPLGWFLALAGGCWLAAGLAWLFADGGQRIDEAMAELPSDDEPVGPARDMDEFEQRVLDAVAMSNQHPAHVHARRQLLRSVRASLSCERWTGETDAELAELLRGGQR